MMVHFLTINQNLITAFTFSTLLSLCNFDHCQWLISAPAMNLNRAIGSMRACKHLARLSPIPINSLASRRAGGPHRTGCNVQKFGSESRSPVGIHGGALRSLATKSALAEGISVSHEAYKPRPRIKEIKVGPCDDQWTLIWVGFQQASDLLMHRCLITTGDL